MRVQAYSAIYGGYDHPKPIQDAGFTYRPIMFTDRGDTYAEAITVGWDPVLVQHHYESPNGDPSIVVPMLNHKYWKCHPEDLDKYTEPDSVDISIWLDGSIMPRPGFEQKALAALGDDDWSCCPHPSRNCIYPEADYSATLTWRYDADSILAQRDHYRHFHPPGWGLFATGVNVRRHSPETIELSHLWWEEILAWSHQDQLSLPVLLRLWRDKGYKWNTNLTWFQDWHLFEHGN